MSLEAQYATDANLKARMAFTPEPVLAYVRSSESYDGGDLSHVRAAVEAAIERDGVFRITTAPGLISCRKP